MVGRAAWWLGAMESSRPVKWAKDRVTEEDGRVVDKTNGKTNRSGLKLFYTAKTGQFKDAFKAYAEVGGSSGTAERPRQARSFVVRQSVSSDFGSRRVENYMFCAPVGRFYGIIYFADLIRRNKK